MKTSALVRKTPMVRTAFKAAEPKPAPGARKRKCGVKGCSERFVPRSMAHKACGPDHAELIAADITKKQKAKAQREDRAKTRAQKEAMKRRGELIVEAQAAFNAWIHWRDRDECCIDCGKPFEPQKVGGSADAGHYLARSIAPHLRFHEDNVFRQRKNCNRPGGTTRENFREGVKNRIGLERVEALEAMKGPAKWTHDDLRAIREEYRARLRKAKKEAE